MGKKTKLKLLVTGAGDIGGRVIALLAATHDITAATSTPANRAALRHLGATPLLADLDKPRSLMHLPCDWDLLLCCAPPPARGRRDTRTRNLLRAKQRRSLSRAPNPSRVVVYLSTSGVYGDCDGQRISESHPLNPQNARAVRRADAERLLTRHARQGAFRLVILRVPGIYSAERLPLTRLAAGTPALAEADDVYTNHIHAADLAAIAVAAFKRAGRRLRPRVRVYHASDDSELKMGEYFDLVADAFGLSHPPRLPRAAIESAIPSTLLSFMSESRRLSNKRMKLELGVRLQMPTVAEGIAQAAQARRGTHASQIAPPRIKSRV